MSQKQFYYSFTIELPSEGKRIDKFLADSIEILSRTKIKEFIDNGALKLNGKSFKDCSYKVNIGDSIELSAKEEIKEIFLSPKLMELNILHEDEHLMVLDKPCGLTVHPGAGNQDNTPVNGLLNYLGDSILKAGDVSRPGIVHRLDKDTSGLMLVAKTSEAHVKLSEMIAAKEVLRIYHAFVYGMPAQKNGTIITQMGRSKREPKKRTVLRSGGKTAITYYKLINSKHGQISLIECKLETGRTHQIRVHMDHIKCPVIGDQTYGRTKNFNLSTIDSEDKLMIKSFRRQALHSKRIEFIHPFTGELISLDSTYPADIMQLAMLFKT